MSCRADLEALCAIPDRVAGSAGEEQAARHVAGRLEAMGLAPSIEAFRFPGTFAGPLVLHAALGLAAGLLAIPYPGPAAAVAGLVALSFWLEYTGRTPVLQRLVPRRVSRNVLARIAPRGPIHRRVVLTAHLDAAYSGLLFQPRIARLAAGNEKVSVPLFLGPFLAMAGLLAVALVRNIHGAGPVLNGLHLFFALVMLVYLLLTLEWLLRGRPVPGAADDAAGVAVVLAAAEELARERPRATEVSLLLTGSEEAHLGGMWHFVRHHLAEYPRSSTYFIAADTLGCGTLVYGSGEGMLSPLAYGHRLRALGDRLAGRPELGPVRSARLKAHTDVHLTARRGYQSISLIGLGDDDMPAHYHWPDDTPENVEDALMDQATRFVLAMVREIDVEGT